MSLNRLFDSGQPITPPPDVQRTSLGIDVLSRFVCNTWDEAMIDAARDAAMQPDSQRRLFVVPNAHVTRLNTANGAVSSIDVFVNGTRQSLPVRSNCAVILAAGTVESTRLALHSFPTSPNNPAQKLIGRNLMAHVRSNIFVRTNRGAFDPSNTLPNAVQVGALLVRGATPQGQFHIQVTASADPFGNSDNLLFAIPDIDLLDSILANQTAGSISLGFRGVSQLFGDKTTSVPNAGGRWINLSPFESDEFGVPRAFVNLASANRSWGGQVGRPAYHSHTSWDRRRRSIGTRPWRS